MENMENDMGGDRFSFKIEPSDREEMVSEMELDQSGIENKFSELGEGSDVFVREGLLYNEGLGMSKAVGFGAKKQNLKLLSADSQVGKKGSIEKERKLSRQDRIELGKRFQSALSSHDWEMAESLILLADPQTLNDFLCIALDSIWFLFTDDEFDGITELIKKVIMNGAYDFTRAALRTSFLASCVSACQSRTMNLADTVTLMAQRLHERLHECNGDDVLKAEASAKVQKFTEWALKCIGFHSRCDQHRDKLHHDSAAEIQLQLSAFKIFLELAGTNLTGKDFTEAFDAACFPLTLFSSSFDPGWSCGTSASAIQGLLSLLVEGGADNVNQCFLEASRFGSTDLVRILLQAPHPHLTPIPKLTVMLLIRCLSSQIAQRNSLDVDVDLALGFASHYGKIGTMECLVEEGNAMAFLGPLMRASERGCLPVVKWFVGRGCQDMELCLALTAATSSSQVEVAAYLLPQVPQHVLAALSIEILKAAGDRSGGSLEGVAFLLRSDFLGDPAATYSVADNIVSSDDDTVAPELRTFLETHWSEAAFSEGLLQGQEHFINMVRVLNRGESPMCLGDLPAPVRVAIAYLPLYRECSKAGGCLWPQKLRGQLVEAVKRLGGGILNDPSQSRELLAVLEHHLQPFLPSMYSAS